MEKLKVGIVGYGNLGREVERQVKLNSQFELVAIFSRRKIEGLLPFEEIENFKGKIDMMFLCVGSQNELEQTAFRVIKNFNTLDCYDNHARLKAYIQKQNKLAKENDKVALCALGWDPGLFSLMRGLFASIGRTPYTFWGKGLSQGHTQALKAIPHVEDAIQFTLPNKQAINKVKHGAQIKADKHLHKRLCYVVCEREHEAEIKKQIVSMPDYFLGYKTTVKFVTQTQLDKIKNFAHKGVVLTPNEEMEFNLNLPSNPAFTASVVLGYACAVLKLVEAKKFGAFTVFDLPLNLILPTEKWNYI